MGAGAHASDRAGQHCDLFYSKFNREKTLLHTRTSCTSTACEVMPCVRYILTMDYFLPFLPFRK